MKKILDRIYGETKDLIANHRAQLEKVTAELLQRETLGGDEFYDLLGIERPRKEQGVDIGPTGSPNGMTDLTTP